MICGTFRPSENATAQLPLIDNRKRRMTRTSGTTLQNQPHPQATSKISQRLPSSGSAEQLNKVDALERHAKVLLYTYSRQFHKTKLSNSRHHRRTPTEKAAPGFFWR